MKNFYHILGINRSATPTEIKTAYRKLAVKFHPDKNPNNSLAEEKFKEINQAYQVLSNPEKKKWYDYSIDYEAFQYIPHTHRTTYTTRQNTTTRRYHEIKYKYGRLDRIGNWWAAGFLIFVICFTIIAVNVNTYYEKKRQKELVVQASLLFQDAQNDYHNGNYSAALLKLNHINILNSGEFDIFALKEEVFHRILDLGDNHLENGNHRSALEYYYLIVDNFKYVNVSVYYNIVTCQKYLGNYNEAIELLMQITKSGYDEIANTVEIASIFRLELNNYPKALEYYSQSLEAIEAQYQYIYGNAYPLTVNPEATPQLHYEAYLGYGITVRALGFYQNAMSAFNWAIFLRPYLNEAYIEKAECALIMEDKSTACDCYTVLTMRGADEFEDHVKETCD